MGSYGEIATDQVLLFDEDAWIAGVVSDSAGQLERVCGGIGVKLTTPDDCDSDCHGSRYWRDALIGNWCSLSNG